MIIIEDESVPLVMFNKSWTLFSTTRPCAWLEGHFHDFVCIPSRIYRLQPREPILVGWPSCRIEVPHRKRGAADFEW